MRIMQKKISGMTMVELMIAVFLFVMVGGILVSALFVGMRHWFMGFDYVWLGQQARLSIDRMSNELYQVRPGSTYSDILIEDYYTGQFEGGGRIVTFKIPVVCGYEVSPGNMFSSYYNGPTSINWGASGNVGWEIKYRVNDSHQLIREIWNPSSDSALPVSSSILANNIESVTFRGYYFSATGVINYTFVSNASALNIEIKASKQPLFNVSLNYILACDIIFRN